MNTHPPAIAAALRALREWKQHLAGEDETFAKLDEELDAVAEADPRAFLEAIAAFLAGVEDMDVIAPLAAGPLEDLLGAHGEALIGDVERLARDNAAFRHALGGVWQNEMSDAVWERVLSAGPDQRW